MNMKKILLMGALVLVLWGGVLLGQEVQKPYSYTFDKGVGECVFTGVSLDQVWAVAVKVLLLDKYKIVSTEKPSGSMVAERRGIAGWNCDLSLFFKQRGPDVCLTSSTYEPPGQQQKGIDDELRGITEKMFYDKVAELLYSKAEK